MDSPTNTLDLYLIENLSTTELFALQNETNQKITQLEEIISDCKQKVDIRKVKEIEIIFRRILPFDLAKDIATRYETYLFSLWFSSTDKIRDNMEILTHIEIQLEYLYETNMYYDTEVDNNADWSDQSI